MRRWDIVGGLTGLATSALDLVGFYWAGLDTSRLTDDAFGLFVAGSFIFAYGLVGFVCGRLYMARRRSRADADRIAAQLVALEESRQRLVQSEKLAAIGRLAAGIAHEVRNPLGVIRASASMVQENFDAQSDDHRACELITDEIDRLDGLIGALLAFAKPARMKLSATALTPVVERAATLAEESRDLVVERELDAALGSVRADPDLLTQLLLGFFVNASEAGASRVRVSGQSRGGTVALEVTDDGPGIPEADRPRVFEPFFTTKASGTGLGLSMAARIVEAHGGALEVVAGRGLGERGQGACFAVELPIEGPTVVTEAA